MIHHLLKIIWKERKTNAWIVLEFIVVFGILWFCFDYGYYITKSYLEPQGYNLDNTYIIQMENSDGIEVDPDTRYEITMTLVDRISKYPGVQYVSFSNAAIPYSWNRMLNGYRVNNDSTWQAVATHSVTPEYFKVFEMEVTKGKIFEGSGIEGISEVVISPDRHHMFGNYPDALYRVEEVKEISRGDPNDPASPTYRVSGVVAPMKNRFADAFESHIYLPLMRSEMFPENNEIAIRISPSVATGFEERFKADMEAQLSIEPYALNGIHSLKKQRTQATQTERDNLKSVMAISIFLIANIFLGIIGTFWARVQARRSEIGLRIALGSSKKEVRRMILAETWLMLFISSIVATYISLNLGQTDFLSAFGIPAADRVKAGLGAGQDMVIYLITLGFLALISGLAVWYPARLATNMEPAQALRDE